MGLSEWDVDRERERDRMRVVPWHDMVTVRAPVKKGCNWRAYVFMLPMCKLLLRWRQQHIHIHCHLQNTLNPERETSKPRVFVVGCLDGLLVYGWFETGWRGVGIYRFYNCGNSLSFPPTIWGGISGMFICFLCEHRPNDLFGVIWAACTWQQFRVSAYNLCECVRCLCVCI